jgi:hypothetical protein
MLTASVIAEHGNTRETTPRHIWMHEVITLASVSIDDMERYFTRARLNRAYYAGEPVWMAADAVSQFVCTGKREDRIEREVNYLAGKMKVSDGGL